MGATVAYRRKRISLPYEANSFFMHFQKARVMVGYPIKSFLRTIENLYPFHSVKINGFITNQAEGFLYTITLQRIFKIPNSGFFVLFCVPKF